VFLKFKEETNYCLFKIRRYYLIKGGKMFFTNNYTKRIWINPENTNISRYLYPGQGAYIDGFKPPKWGGDWLKLSGFGRCSVNINGDFVGFSLIPKFLYESNSSNTVLYKKRPGRKKDPFSTWTPEPK